jgi:uncharacterized protein with FMN-binding domain
MATKKQISRRDFIKGMAAGATSLVALGALQAIESKSYSTTGSTSSTSSAGSAGTSAARYTPGTYTATSTGMGEVTMTATFDENSILDIQLDVSNETEGIGQAAADELIQQCLSAQSSNIDGVSGATVTTDAVKACLDDCIAQASGSTVSAAGTSQTEQTTWRTAPDPIDDSEIKETYETEVGIVGMGYAGLAAYRTLAEAGVDVIVAEAMTEDSWWTVGHDIGHINSNFQKERGIPEVDVLEFVNNWQVQAQNKSNVSLVMQFAKNCGDMVDWFLEPVSDEIKNSARFLFWPENENTVRQLNNGYRYYPGTIQWWEDSWNGLGTVNNGDGLELKNLSWANRDYVAANFPNATVLYGTKGVQLVKDGDRVTGFIAKNADGDYIKILAKKGVILSGGGFGGNQEMCEELLSYVDRLFTPDEDFNAVFGRDGSTIQMGVWAGGRLEADISSMNFDSMTIPDYLPGPLWVDSNGERFQNEAFAGPEINGFFMARTRRGNIISIFDSNYEKQILTGYPGHQAFDYSDETAVNEMKANFEEAKSASPAGTESGFYCADTLEELADALGYDEEQKATFVSTVEEYNKMCANGIDTDFGKDPAFLNAIETGPFYAHLTTPSLGFALATTGGFVTTNHQQVLDENYEPIPGLYASGNTCGMRFGSAYITPMAGVSIGTALTLGRELGKYLAEQS